jgi:hypothetical protein
VRSVLCKPYNKENPGLRSLQLQIGVIPRLQCDDESRGHIKHNIGLRLAESCAACDLRVNTLYVETPSALLILLYTRLFWFDQAGT